MPSSMYRLPAEWEPQSAILIAWPHAGTDWAEHLVEVERTYVALAAAVTRFERLVVCVASPQLRDRARGMLADKGIDEALVRFVAAEYDDTWLRDTGPITLRSDDDYRLLDFRFTGWGGKFEASRDDALVEHLESAGLFRRAQRESIAFALEGGAIDTDGEGTLLTTWACLNQRHPQSSREELSARLATWLAQDRVLWLDHGFLDGDDTDAHVDTLARFASPTSIVYQGCDDPSDTHYPHLRAMGEELAALRTREGRPYRLHELPWARPILDEGRRLAASYANFLIINGAVLMPAYGDDADARAQAVLQHAFPDREIVPVPCRSLIWQNGSLHCITMQLPEGVIR